MNLILDGANIARQGVDSSGNGTQIRAAIDRLLSDGYTLYPVLAQFRMSGKRAFPNMEWVDAYKVHERVNFVQAPSGTDDDSFILDLAIQLKGVVVSNDLYRDHKERLGKHANRYCGGSKATHRMMFSIAGDLFIPDPNFKMPAEEKVDVTEHAIQVPENDSVEVKNSKNKSTNNKREKKSSNQKEKKIHKITKGTVKSAIIQHADLPMPVSKLGTYIPNLITKSTGRKVSKRELRDEAGFGNSSWINIFARMGPEIQIDRTQDPPMVRHGNKAEKSKHHQSANNRKSSKSNDFDYSESLELSFKEIIAEGRHSLVSEKSFLSSLLPFLKVDEVLIIPWSVLCEKHLKRTKQRLSKIPSEELSDLLNQVRWPLEGKRKRIVRHSIKENELHLWGR